MDSILLCSHASNPALTWSGRGRKPQWFEEALAINEQPYELAVS
ncbi:H-NS histone family protein [Marivita sp.]